MLSSSSRAPKEPRPFASWAGLAAIVLLAFAHAESVDARTDTNTGTVRVIFVGEIEQWNFPYPSWIDAEPKFTLHRVPCALELFSEIDARRFARLYLPRTYEALIGFCDVILFEDFAFKIFPEGTREVREGHTRGRLGDCAARIRLHS